MYLHGALRPSIARRQKVSQLSARPFQFLLAWALFGLAPLISFVPHIIAGNARGVRFVLPMYLLFWGAILSGLFRGYASSLILIGVYTLWQFCITFGQGFDVSTFSWNALACLDLIGAFVLCLSGASSSWLRDAIEVNSREKAKKQSSRRRRNGRRGQDGR